MSKTKILLVEDDAAGLKMTERMLAGEGYEVKTASDGEHALSLAQQEKFDIVFTDLVLRNLNGDELCIEVKKLHPQTEVVLLTGYPMAVAKKLPNFLNAGGKEMLTKPFSKDQLVNLTKKILDERTKKS